MEHRHNFTQPPKIKGSVQEKATWKFDPLFIKALRGFVASQTALNGFRVSMPNAVQTAVFQAYPAVRLRYKQLKDAEAKKDAELRAVAHEAISSYHHKATTEKEPEETEPTDEDEAPAVDPGRVQLTVIENWRDKLPIKDRLEALGLKSPAMINALINVVTGKPLLGNLKDAELEILSKTLDTFESGERVLPDSWYAAGHPPTKGTAETDS